MPEVYLTFLENENKQTNKNNWSLIQSYPLVSLTLVWPNPRKVQRDICFCNFSGMSDFSPMDCCQISPIISSEFEQINELLFPLESSENHRFPEDY